MELAGLLADGARWALLAVFGLAAAEKAETLLHRAAAWHPVMLARARWRRRAAVLIGASLLADLAAVAALLIRPVWGAVLAAALVGLYSAAAKGVHGSGGGEDCRCLWKVLRTRTRRGLLARNLGLLCLAGLAAVGPEAASLRGTAAGGLFLVMAGSLTRLVDWTSRRSPFVNARERPQGSHAAGQQEGTTRW